jgi:hypothetical protein
MNLFGLRVAPERPHSLRIAPERLHRTGDRDENE